MKKQLSPFRALLSVFRLGIFPFLKLSLYQLTSTITWGPKGEKAIFREKLIAVLNRRNRSNLEEDRITVVNKLKKAERLTHDEFWQVYESIHQKGPVVKYLNPQTWVGIDE